MPITLSLLFVALIVKDTSYLGDSYVLRGASEFLCLVMGVSWWLFRAKSVPFRRYVTVTIYVLFIAVSAILSRQPLYAGLQVVSLAGVLLFFAAHFEMTVGRRDPHAALSTTIVLVGGAVLAASLILAKIGPGLAYLYDPMAGQSRFRGMFGQPAMMGSAAGLVWGFAMFGKWNRITKLGLGAVSLLCLVLTTSRTFWVAWLFATIGVWWWLAVGTRWRTVVVVGVALLVAILGVTASGLRIPDQTMNHMLRTDSIANLTGRVGVWEFAWLKFQERPLLGYGFTTGDDAFKEAKSAASLSKSKLKTTRYTLHNGYIQALLDSGLLGAAAYLVALVQSMLNIVRTGDKTLGVPLFILVFTAVANLGETMMFSAATFQSLLGWYGVLFGLSLGHRSVGSGVGADVAVRPLVSPRWRVDRPPRVASAV